MKKRYHLISERQNWDRISSIKNAQDQDINGGMNGFHDDQDDRDLDESEIHTPEIQTQNHTRKNSEMLYDNIEHPVNGEAVKDDKVPSSDRLTSESESDEEFCDTSDQPSPVYFLSNLQCITRVERKMFSFPFS